MDIKAKMLACRRSQKEWLDKSQGIGSYLEEMRIQSREAGRISGKFEMAEGWRRRNHLGFTAADTDPLSEALKGKCWINPDYESKLTEGALE